jgi:HD-GYP domain-containing protein (c-di-GMP phosphodiesterase class II)/DNA-binding CsgD family transcriptional regulator
LVAFLGGGFRWLQGFLQTHCAGADFLASRLGLGDDVCASLAQSYELWNGKHSPLGLKGKKIQPAARLLHLADIVEVLHRVGGLQAAVNVARKRSGTEFDPELVEMFCEQAASLFADLEVASSWDMVIAAEPALQVHISDAQLETALEAIGDFIDIKSPYTIGHSRSVADLAAAAARDYGLSEVEKTTLRRAALVHDFGRLGVSNGIWDKRGPLTQAEMERVRLHPYLTERMLAFSPALAPLGAIAVQYHERMNGSGYPRGIAGDAITPSGRLLAAADVYHAMTEPRPYREAHSPEEAASLVRAEVTGGRLDSDAVNAVLRAAGHRIGARRDWPAELTAREVEVLKLVACCLSNKEIAERLVISRKTAANHVEHIYSKIGVSKRAGAGLFAVQHGLMTDAYLQ